MNDKPHAGLKLKYINKRGPRYQPAIGRQLQIVDDRYCMLLQLETKAPG